MESDNFCKEKFIEEYNLILNQLENIFHDENDKKNIQVLKNESNENKLARGKMFYDHIEDEEYFDLLCKSKVKLFSTKEEKTKAISTSLFGEQFSIKKLINNQSEKTKDIIWKYLHLFYFLFESCYSNRKERKSIISKLLKEKEDKLTNQVKNELLNVDVNEETNDMIDDIVKSFEKTLSGENANPFESIMEITQNITDKYSGKIESGDIELEKLMGSIQQSIPGMPDLMNGGLGGLGGKKAEPKEKVIIDEDFSTDKVELGDKDKKEESGSGMNLSNMLKMMNSMNGAGGSGEGDPNTPDLGGLFSMLNKLDSVDNEEDAEKLKSEMDSYLQDQLGVDVGKLNEQIEEAQKKMDTKIEELPEEDGVEEPEQD